MKRTQGFTLIELVVVITILGILAAVALPRFVGLQSDARIAKLNAARAAVQGAASMIYGAAQVRTGIAQPNCPATGTAVTTISATTGGGTVCTANGLINVINWNPTANLPGASPGGVIDAAGLTSVFPATAVALAAEGYTAAAGGTAANSITTVTVTGGTNAANCSFTYRPANAAGTTGSAATISAVITTGC